MRNEVLATFEKDHAELELRVRLNSGQDSGVSVAGSGLIWNKQVSTPLVASSFGTWLRRNNYPTSLDRLEEFAQAMKKLNNTK